MLWPEQASGLHLAISGHNNIYLQLPDDIKAQYVDSLKDRIIKCEKEYDTLAKRLQNDNYVKKAPAELVAETRAQLADKEKLLVDMRAELKAL